MNNHSSHDYHLTACTRMSEFLAKYKNPSDSVNIMLDSEAKKKLEANQQVIDGWNQQLKKIKEIFL